MATVKALLHPKKNNDGNKIYRLAIRVTIKRQQSYLLLGYNVEPKDWDETQQKVKRSNPKYAQLNRLVRKRVDELEDVIFDSDSMKKNLTAKQVINQVKSNDVNGYFFELAEEYIQEKKKKGDHNRAISDNSMINNLKEFANNSKLTFEEIDENFLNKFKVYSLAKGRISERTIMNVFVLVRLLYNRAIKRGIVEQKHYPFGKDKVRIKMPQSIKIGLNEEEIKSIEELELENGSKEWHSRNIFLFSFYLAGIRVSDVLKMKWNDIKNDRIYYRMGKNNKVVSLKMPLRTLEIIEHYKGNKKETYIFPELNEINPKDTKAMYNKIKRSTKVLNEGLKKVGELAEIDKKITNHISRHSFGNIAGDKISPQMLQKLYRHSNLSTTIGYQGNFIHKDADEALDSVLNF